MPPNATDQALYVLDGLQPETPRARDIAEEALLAYVRWLMVGTKPDSLAYHVVFVAYERARERCGWSAIARQVLAEEEKLRKAAAPPPIEGNEP